MCDDMSDALDKDARRWAAIRSRLMEDGKLKRSREKGQWLYECAERSGRLSKGA